MDNIGKGFIAGLVATIVLSILLLLKNSMGLMADLDPVKMLTQMSNQYAGTPLNSTVGWAIHFFIGTIVWGGLFGAFNHLVPGKTELGKGVLLLIGGWLLMMFVVMPMGGAGLFGIKLGILASIVTLVLHVIFGLVLGYTYARLMHVSATRQIVPAYR